MESPRSSLGPLAWAAGSLALLWALVSDLTPGDPIALGRTVREVTPEVGRFLGVYSLFGSLAAIALAVAIGRWLDRRPADRGTTPTPDRQWILLGVLAAVLLPTLVRVAVLRDMPLADDEGAYRFMAEVFAAGRAWVETPEPALFFDQRFLVHDGRSYAQYFPGWPALLAPFTWLGLTAWANAIFAALAVPPLFFTLRRLAGARWARVGLGLYVLSPMSVLGAATLLSHTSCVTALAWLVWWSLRATDDDASIAVHAGMAVAFSVAFAVRPLAALGVGVPFLLHGLWALRRRPDRLRALVAFAVPAAVGAAAFLGVVAAQTGSPFTTPYERYLDYSRANDFRFSLFHAEPGDGARELDFVSPKRSLAIAAAGLHRLGFDLHGWPVPALAFVALTLTSLARPGRRLLWASIGCSLISHVGVGNVGIDAFAPMHYIELGWPLLLLGVLGLADLDAGVAEHTGRIGVGWQLAVAMSLIALAVYWPTRLHAVARMAADTAVPHRAVADLGPAVVFTPDPLIRSCHPPTRGWVFGRPANDPFFRDPIVWANHLSIEADRLLVERRFPDRDGVLLAIDPECRPVLIPLDDPAAAAIPDARVTGIAEVVEALRGLDALDDGE
ncbi:MAG: hypothetical protein AAGE94_09550 [Acidobacteriota bacterium]